MDAAIEPVASTNDIDTFINRWKGNSGSERSNFQSFMRDLCDLLQLPLPDPGAAVCRCSVARCLPYILAAALMVNRMGVATCRRGCRRGCCRCDKSSRTLLANTSGLQRVSLIAYIRQCRCQSCCLCGA
jgi:hypothetical protein